MYSVRLTVSLRGFFLDQGTSWRHDRLVNLFIKKAFFNPWIQPSRAWRQTNFLTFLLIGLNKLLRVRLFLQPQVKYPIRMRIQGCFPLWMSDWLKNNKLTARTQSQTLSDPDSDYRVPHVGKNLSNHKQKGGIEECRHILSCKHVRNCRDSLGRCRAACIKAEMWIGLGFNSILSNPFNSLTSSD